MWRKLSQTGQPHRLSFIGLAGYAALLVTASLSAATALGDSAAAYSAQPWGYDTPASRCVVCHSLEKGGPFRTAPNLWNIMGAEVARDRSWYAYSPALIRKGGTWNADELDRFLEDASAYAPGSTKSIRVADPEERREIIEFLATLTD